MSSNSGTENKISTKLYQIEQFVAMRVYLGERYRGHTDPGHCGSRVQCNLPSTLLRDTGIGSGGIHNMDDT